jgi:hypothetical protein
MVGILRVAASFWGLEKMCVRGGGRVVAVVRVEVRRAVAIV